MEPGYRSATADDDSYAVDGPADTTTVQGTVYTGKIDPAARFDQVHKPAEHPY
ncbi:hypothetical protein E4U23_003772, partial [Claviceps purpurea]